MNTEERAKEFYMNPNNWGNENWDRKTATMFDKSEMFDFAATFAKSEIRAFAEKVRADLMLIDCGHQDEDVVYSQIDQLFHKALKEQQ